MAGPLRCEHHPWQPPARPGPRPWRRGETVGDLVHQRLVVDPPAVELRPRLVDRCLAREGRLVEHLHRGRELRQGQRDGIAGQRVGVEADAEHRRDLAQADIAHAQEGVRLGGGTARRQRQVEGRGVEHRVERHHP